MNWIMKSKTIVNRGKIDTNQWMTRKLWGFASEPPFHTEEQH